MTKPAAQRIVYRNIAVVLVRGGAVLAVALVLLLGMVMYAFTTFRHADTTSRTAAAFMVLIAALLIWIAIRIVGSRISADPDGVFVHTVFRPCKYISWDDITGFELVPARRLNNLFTRSAVAIAVMRTSERTPLYCVGASFTERCAAAESMLEALRASHDGTLNLASPADQH
jgi:Bacterial PH domain